MGGVGARFKREGVYAYLYIYIHIGDSLVVHQKPIQHYKAIIIQLKSIIKKYRTEA